MDSKGQKFCSQLWHPFAQQESQSLSQNVGLRYRYQQGEIQVNWCSVPGYTKDENKVS